MKIVGFPLDVSHSQDSRIVQGLHTRKVLVQATLDLIQAGDVEPAPAAIAVISGVSSRALFQQFTSLADLYVAAFDLAVSRAFAHPGPVDATAPLANRIERLVCDRAQLFEEWLPVWYFAERVRRGAPAVGQRVLQLRRLLRERLAVWFSNELGDMAPGARDHILDSLDFAFGLDSWMNMRARQRLSRVGASRTWRFTAQTIVLQAFTGSGGSAAAA